VKERGLAGAGSAEDGEELAIVHSERDAVQDGDIDSTEVIGLVEVLDAEDDGL